MVIKMKLFVTLNRKNLTLILAIIIILFLLTAWAFSLKLTAIDGSTHEKREIFIEKTGYHINPEGITSKETVIPLEFSDVYKKYNQLQKESGFDLSDYKGKKVTIYTYPLWKSEKELHLIVCDGKIIGGDVSDVALNGEMKPLKKQEN